MSNEQEVKTRTTRRALFEEGLRSQLADNKLYHKLAKAIQSHQLAVYIFGNSCCQLAILQALNNKYFTIVDTAAEANLLLIHGHISHKCWPLLNAVYEQLCYPKLIVTIGACSNDSLWAAPNSGPDLTTSLPLDLQISSCSREGTLDSLAATLRQLWLDKLASSHTIQEVSNE